MRYEQGYDGGAANTAESDSFDGRVGLAESIAHVESQSEKVMALLSDLEGRLGYVTQPDHQTPGEDITAMKALPAAKSAARDDLERVARGLRSTQQRIQSLLSRAEV